MAEGSKSIHQKDIFVIRIVSNETLNCLKIRIIP